MLQSKILSIILIFIVIIILRNNIEKMTSDNSINDLAKTNLDNLVSNIVRNNYIKIPYDINCTNFNYTYLDYENNLVPYGVIIAFSNLNIPNGWVICNGSNNTPNLRNKFIYGKDNSRTSRNFLEDGKWRHALSENEIPSHTHDLPYNVHRSKSYSIESDSNEQRCNYSSQNTVNYTGGNNSHENTHPHIKLIYIMKTNINQLINNTNTTKPSYSNRNNFFVNPKKENLSRLDNTNTISLSAKYDKLLALNTSNLLNENFYFLGKIKVNNNILQDLNKTLPIGSIVAYNNNNIPAGWKLCNGVPPTPDLRGRSILTINANSVLKNTGGAEEVELTENQIPSHNHTLTHSIPIPNTAPNNADDDGGPDYHGAKTSGTTRYTSYTGGGQPHNNMPPFHVLNYIMRIE